jgi:hypothetical protein
VFDDLDDPGPFAVPPGARDAVGARAARLRLRRRAGMGAGVLSAVAALVLVTYVLRPAGRDALTPVAPGIATQTPTPSPSTTVVVGTPSPSVPPKGVAPQPDGFPHRPTGSTRPPLLSPGPVDYSRGPIDCSGTWDPAKRPAGRAPYPGVTLALRLPAEVTGAHHHDHEPTGEAVLANGGDAPVTFWLATSWRGVNGRTATRPSRGTTLATSRRPTPARRWAGPR